MDCWMVVMDTVVVGIFYYEEHALLFCQMMNEQTYEMN